MSRNPKVKFKLWYHVVKWDVALILLIELFIQTFGKVLMKFEAGSLKTNPPRAVFVKIVLYTLEFQKDTLKFNLTPHL